MPLLVLLLIAGVVELSVLVLVGEAIGVLPTIGLLLIAAGVGSWLMRREGRRTLLEISEAARQRRPPTREFADGALVAIGGMLIILPGFVSDVAGLICLFPPTRALLRARIERAAERHAPPMAGPQPGYNEPPDRRNLDGVIDGEIISVSDDDPNAVPPQIPPQAPRPGDGEAR